MQKIILYYKFVPLKSPEVVRAWQVDLCRNLKLKGRVLISKDGINGTLGGEQEDLQEYIRQTSDHHALHDIGFKWSDGSRDDFPRLSIKVRDETVTLGIQGVRIDKSGVVNAATKIEPTDLDEFMREHPDAVFFDGRNDYEAAIGHFKDAVTPPVNHFRELPRELDKPEYEQLKTKPVVTYCTGGIRCELLSALMKNKGFREVYQLNGGIVKYGEVKGDRGLWEGKCFVFDKRMSVSFSDSSLDIGECRVCSSRTSRYVNCANKACNSLILICNQCESNITCSDKCLQKLAQPM